MNEAKMEVGCDLWYQIDSPAVFILNVEVSPSGFYRILEEKLTLPSGLDAERFELGATGNRIVRFNAQPGQIAVRYRATVQREPDEDAGEDIQETPVQDLPPDTLPFLFPSRYCESDKLMRFARHHFGNMTPGYLRVSAICDWIYANIEYLHGETDAQTSAHNTVTERAGVCRDFAHLGIALCRALNIPARFVTGYALKLEPPDFHAYFEAFLDGQWRAFDATRLAPREGLVRIGSGPDASQASFASIFGNVTMTTMNVFAWTARH